MLLATRPHQVDAETMSLGRVLFPETLWWSETNRFSAAEGTATEAAVPYLQPTVFQPLAYNSFPVSFVFCFALVHQVTVLACHRV